MPRHTGLIDWDPVARVKKLFHRLHDGDWAYETVQDVAPVFDANKEAQNHCDPDSADGSFRQVARIPVIFIQKLWDEKGIDIYNKDHWPALKRILNDPEYRFLRTDNSVL